MKLAIVVSFAALVLSGCAQGPDHAEIREWEDAYDAMIEEYIDNAGFHNRLQVAIDIRNKKPSSGMTRTEVYYSLRLVGDEKDGDLSTTHLSPAWIVEPAPITVLPFRIAAIKVHRTVTPSGTATQWVVPNARPGYFSFEDGILTSCQD
ncbi:MAG: hypothetical protein AAEJ04_04495 [Planctomycetota bacterium]